MVKNPPANAGDARDLGLIPGSRRPPGIRNGNPLQYSCLGNLMDRGAWRATAHGITESDTTEHLNRTELMEEVRAESGLRECHLTHPPPPGRLEFKSPTKVGSWRRGKMRVYIFPL